MSSGAPDWWIQGIIPMLFKSLGDTPGDFIDRAGLVLTPNDVESDLVWSEGAIDAHSSRHEYGGADVISLAGLAIPNHAGQHAFGESDVLDLSGITPGLHKLTHKSGGSDQIDVSGLTPKLHHITHEAASTDEIIHGDMKDFGAYHHTKFTAAEARAAINDVIGSDGKLDADLDLDTHIIDTPTGLSLGPVYSEDVTVLSQNTYFDGAWKRKKSGFAMMITFTTGNGMIEFYTAANLAADTSIAWTQSLQIDSNANITIIKNILGINLKAPVSIHHSLFTSGSDAYDWLMSADLLQSRSNVSLQHFYTSLQLPDGLTVSKITMYGNRNRTGTKLNIHMYRDNRVGVQGLMASVVGNWDNGWGGRFNDSISNAGIDNDTYDYFLLLEMESISVPSEVGLSSVRIDFA